LPSHISATLSATSPAIFSLPFSGAGAKGWRCRWRIPHTVRSPERCLPPCCSKSETARPCLPPWSNTAHLLQQH
jgi:hypothetical protein